MARRIETALMSVLLLGVILLEALQIVLRNFFSYSIYWADGFIRLCVLWLAVIGAVAASREGRHLAIGIVSRYFPKAWHRPSAILSNAFACLVSAILAWHATRFVIDTWRFGDAVLGGLPAWPFQAVMPVGFALISWRFLVALNQLLRRPA
jgi:TRAP-type C4-dicarboxylate transport system permease small subunit